MQMQIHRECIWRGSILRKERKVGALIYPSELRPWAVPNIALNIECRRRCYIGATWPRRWRNHCICCLTTSGVTEFIKLGNEGRAKMTQLLRKWFTMQIWYCEGSQLLWTFAQRPCTHQCSWGE